MVIYDSTDLLRFISKSSYINVLDSTCIELGLSMDELKSYLDELESYGYVQRFIRSFKITDEGIDYLKE